MATGGWSSPLTDQVTSLTDCPHCKSLCLGPSILPCGHLLCRKCLHDVLQHVRAGCPKCQQPLRLPRDQNLSISQVMENMSSEPVMEHLVLQELGKNKHEPCLNCPNNYASHVCLDCQDYYCDSCSAIHLRGRSTKDHVVRLLPQPPPNTSSTASATPGQPSSSMDSIRNIDDRQSRGPSRDESREIKWVKKAKDELEQSLSKHEEMETTAQNIVSLGQQLVNSLQAHRQLLLTYHQHLSRLEATLTPDPGSYYVKIRGSDVRVKMKRESMDRRLYDVRKEHHCPNMEELERIEAQLTLLQSADDELRVVLLGKSGVGKSSLGNTLIGRNVFEVSKGLKSLRTDKRQVCTRIRFGTKLQVTDTPGLFATHRENAEVEAEVRDTVMAVPLGPHILILVLRCDYRFTTEEYSVFTKLKTMFGASICRHMIVVFNGIDTLDDSQVTQRAALDKEVQMNTGYVRHLLDDVSYRYYGNTNKASRSTRDAAACEVIDMMKSLAAENFWTYPGLNDEDDEDDE